MANLARNASSVIHRFLHLATSPTSAHNQVIDCCGDELTYAQLHLIVRGIAHDLRSKFGHRPVVSIVCENTPYTLATILATWLLGGVAAPLDVHAPEALLKGMLHGVRPSCVVLPDTATANIKLVQDAGFVVHPFKASESGIPTLLSRFAGNSVALSDIAQLPTPEDDALYVYTSSASSVSNLKCVPINHGTLLYNAALELAVWRVRRGISKSVEEPAPLERFRTLGWGPFSHIMAVANDFTCHTMLPGGCYIFGIPPSTYPISAKGADAGVERPVAGQAYDVGALLLKTAKRARADLIAGVPWLFKRMMEECEKDPEYLTMLKGCKQLLAGGALVDPEVQAWADANELKLDVSVGMTEIGGALFEVESSGMSVGGGYPANQVLVADAKLTLLDEDGKESDSYGELVISSKYISTGYRNFASTAHFAGPDGTTSFRTGDMYSLANGRLLWLGRRDDYIQLGSAELLDPRIPEEDLLKNPSIGRVAFVGNNFLRGAADFVCAIVEPPASGFRPQDVLKAFAAVNKDLHPPLRVPVSRVLVLNEGETIPINRKGLIWRKALEEKFGDRLHALLNNPSLSKFSQSKKSKKTNFVSKSYEELEVEVLEIIAAGLGLSKDLLNDNRDSTFAELGMDSNMATRIVSKINTQYGLDFPMSACHDYVDVEQLSRAIFERLNRGAAPQIASHSIGGFSSSDDEIVIVGQAFRLPGQVNDEAAFWSALMEKRQVLEHMGSDRWDHASFYYPPTNPPTKPPPGMINFTQMGRIEVAKYDNAFFGISPAEAYFVTPGSRVALEVAVEALEDANIPLSKVKGSNMAVFVAQGPEFGYPDLIYTEKGFEVYDRYYGTGVADSAISGRMSYFLDIHGPSVTLNTACSGGLVALDNAMSAIRYGQCETAIVSSVNVHVWPGNFGFLSANQMSSLHGRCATFSAEADGYVPSEGAVAFIVKSKRAAIRDGDNILGIVKSTSVQHNGRSQGLVAPNSKAQVALQRTVLASAGLQAKDIDFVENHGTGTILGDMMEIQAINEVFGGSHSAEAPLVLGAAKTVFGHTESSAGLVGVAKALQTLRHGVVPGLAHLTGNNLSPRLDTSVTPLHISHLPTVLPRRENDLPLRALSLSFGFAGTIAAVILEEYKQPEISVPSPLPSPAIAAPHLFVISAKTEKGLREYLNKYIDYCSKARDSDLPNICYTASIGREHYRFRFACACTNIKDLVRQLQQAVDGGSFVAIPSKPRIAFAFGGQGTQWQGMGRALSDVDKVFAAYLKDYASKASALLGIDIVPLLFDLPESSKANTLINETHVSQSCIFVFQCAMLKWLEHVGIRPNATISHSLGEVAAAVASEAMDFDIALEFVKTRSNAMRPENTNGGLMAAIRAPEDIILKRIASLGFSDSVVIAAYNTSTQHVVSGDENAVRALVDALAKESIKGTILSVNQGFHSHCIEKSLTPIFEHLKHESDNIQRPNIPHYSSVKGHVLKKDDRQDADYWVRQARQPVRFADAAKAMLSEGNLTAVVDLGPQNVISHLLKDAASLVNAGKVALLPVCDRPTTNSLTPLVQSLASLFMLGVSPDFEKLYSSNRTRPSRIAIPTYPWQRQRHYPSIIPSRTTKIKGSEEIRSYSKRWLIGRELGPLLKNDHTVNGVPIVPAAALAMFVSVEARKACSSLVTVNIKYQKPLLLEDLEQDVLALDIQGDKITCTHIRGTTTMGVICSGSLKVVNSEPTKPASRNGPDSTIDKTATYQKFADNLVSFGPSFQCIQSIDRYEKASAHINAPSSGNVQHDFVRKMDAILHMFGAVAPESPDDLKNGGSFLPSAVNGLTLHATTLPEKLVCEYRLPIKVTAGGKRMTAEFKAFAESGELLVACDEYVVSWVPSSAPVARSKPAESTTPRASESPAAVAPPQQPKSTPQPVEKVSKETIQKSVAESLKTILGLTEADMENFDASTPILSLGIDSISFTQLRSDVMEKYEVDLPLSFLGEEGLALSEYADFILSNVKKTDVSPVDDSSESSSSGTAKDSDASPIATSVTSFLEVTPKEAEKFISKSLQDVLGMTVEDMKNFDSSTPVLSLGIDSISFTQLRADVLKEYNVDIPMTFLGEDELTLGELANFTVEKMKEVPATA